MCGGWGVKSGCVEVGKEWYEISRRSGCGMDAKEAVIDWLTLADLADRVLRVLCDGEQKTRGERKTKELEGGDFISTDGGCGSACPMRWPQCCICPHACAEVCVCVCVCLHLCPSLFISCDTDGRGREWVRCGHGHGRCISAPSASPPRALARHVALQKHLQVYGHWHQRAIRASNGHGILPGSGLHPSPLASNSRGFVTPPHPSRLLPHASFAPPSPCLAPSLRGSCRVMSCASCLACP